MKKSKLLIMCGILTVSLLTGCGASFDITPSVIENYANSNSGIYSDVSSDYEDYNFIEGVYATETDGVHIELWDFDTTGNAATWFNNNVNDLKTNASSSSGSNTSKGGDYTINTSDNYYRVLFSNDKGIYAYGSKDEVISALSSMNIIK